jgi:hypothetical protein
MRARLWLEKRRIGRDHLADPAVELGFLVLRGENEGPQRSQFKLVPGAGA